jgi:hypothetical protein
MTHRIERTCGITRSKKAGVVLQSDRIRSAFNSAPAIDLRPRCLDEGPSLLKSNGKSHIGQHLRFVALCRIDFEICRRSPPRSGNGIAPLAEGRQLQGGLNAGNMGGIDGHKSSHDCALRHRSLGQGLGKAV